MKVLAILQNWNGNDPRLGFVVEWMNTLATQVDELILLTLEQRQESTVANIKIYSLGKEKYQGPFRYFYYLYYWHQQIKKILNIHSPDVVFTHMTPLYSIMAYPYVINKKIPIVTWFLHPKKSWLLMLAHFSSTRVMSATLNSYPYRKDKLVIIGHGINTNFFYNATRESPAPQGGDEAITHRRSRFFLLEAPLTPRPLGWGGVHKKTITPDHPPMLLCVGRISAVKDYLTLIKAVGLIKKGVEGLKLWLVGNALTKKDFQYVKKLNETIRELGLQDAVFFKTAVAPKDLADFYCRCKILVNPTPPGSMDKVVLEAMACGRPVLVASENFKEILGPYADQLFFRFGDEVDLSRKLLWLLQLPQDEGEKMGRFLQKRVMADWSSDALVGKLVQCLKAIVKK